MNKAELATVILQLLCDGDDGDDGKNPQLSDGVWKIGESYLIRTVTNYWTGRLVFIGQQELRIEDAAWIADTGRFSGALLTGELNEIEPSQNDVVIGRGSIVDATVWNHKLPMSQK